MPGANDSASGVAVLLEIARYIANTDNKPEVGVDIIFLTAKREKKIKEAKQENGGRLVPLCS